jgi:hypothetical protein
MDGEATDTNGKAPWHIWVVGIIALLFNAIGAFDFTMTMIQGSAYLETAGMTPAQIEHYEQFPGWMTVVWAIGVWGAIIASVLLLLRNRLAYPLFGVALAAFVINNLYTYVLTDGGKVMGGQMAITSAIIAALLAFFTWYSQAMIKRGVLR